MTGSQGGAWSRLMRAARVFWGVLGLGLAVSASCLSAAEHGARLAAFGINARARNDALQCVPYARVASGIHLFGDAWTWWDQAEGRYGRGYRPKVGAVMAFEPYGKMVLGHVAVVSTIVDARTVLLRHANWSPVGGLRGRVEEDVPAVDVSPGNNWSAVRVWFEPNQGLGGTHWPVSGFIYPVPAVMVARHSAGHRGVHGLSGGRDPIGDIIAHVSAQAGPREVLSILPGKSGAQRSRGTQRASSGGRS